MTLHENIRMVVTPRMKKRLFRKPVQVGAQITIQARHGVNWYDIPVITKDDSKA